MPNLVTFGRNEQGTVGMVEDRPEDSEPSPDSGRAKRPAPTIDLEATEGWIADDVLKAWGR